MSVHQLYLYLYLYPSLLDWYWPRNHMPDSYGILGPQRCLITRCVTLIPQCLGIVLVLVLWYVLLWWWSRWQCKAFLARVEQPWRTLKRSWATVATRSSTKWQRGLLLAEWEIIFTGIVMKTPIRIESPPTRRSTTRRATAILLARCLLTPC